MCAMMQKLRVSSMDMGPHYAGDAQGGQLAGKMGAAGIASAARGCYQWRRMRKLVIQTANGPMEHELTGELVTIGRAAENMIQIDDPSVSGRHAQLNQVGESFHLQDRDSTNGTSVNGETITSVALRVGDQIRFGKVEASFESDVPGEAAPLPVLATAESRPAETSSRPADFANASPFPKRTQEKDPLRKVFFAAAAVGILALLASLLSLAQMQPPALP